MNRFRTGRAAAAGQLAAACVWGFAAAAAAAESDRTPRNPFWPVGYRPASAAPEAADPGLPAADREAEEAARLELAWSEARARLSIQAVSFFGDDRAGAIIGGRAVAPGEVIRMEMDGRIFRWRVMSIDPSGVALERLDVRLEPTKDTPGGQEP